MARKLRDVRLAVHLPLKYRCDADYAAMTPVAGGRACAACDHVVHDLSAMTEREAARFVGERRGQRVCLRYEARPDGTILYRPAEPSRFAPAVMVAALAACTPHEPLPHIPGEADAHEVTAPATVVVPTATPVVAGPSLPEPPDDDIDPCPGPDATRPDEPKKPRPKKPKAKPPETVEYLGFEG